MRRPNAPRNPDRFNHVLLSAVAVMALSGQANDPSDLPEGFTLSDPVWFFTDVESPKCHLLRFNGRPLGQVTTIRRAGDNLVLRRCERLEGNLLAPKSDGIRRVQGWARAWFLVQPGRREPMQIELEGIDVFSNPQPCGNRIAYWAKEDLASSATHSKYFAYIGDLLTREILARRYMGQAWMATDYVFHKPSPQWNHDCTEAQFDDPRYFNEPATLRLGSPVAP